MIAKSGELLDRYACYAMNSYRFNQCIPKSAYNYKLSFYVCMQL